MHEFSMLRTGTKWSLAKISSLFYEELRAESDASNVRSFNNKNFSTCLVPTHTHYEITERIFIDHAASPFLLRFYSCL